jgi:hypothetical protein
VAAVDKKFSQADVTDERNVISVPVGRPAVSDTTDPEESGEFACAVCERTFDDEAALDRHVHDVGLVD